MSTMEATTRPKIWRGQYDFAVDGGAIGDIPLRSNDGAIPTGSRVIGGTLAISTGCASAAGGKMELTVEAARDLLAATLEAALTAGNKDLIVDRSGSSALKISQARAPTLSITLQAFTAGKFELVLHYV